MFATNDPAHLYENCPKRLAVLGKRKYPRSNEMAQTMNQMTVVPQVASFNKSSQQKSAQRQTRQQKLEKGPSANKLDELENTVARTSSWRYLRGIPREINPPAMYWFNAHQCAKCGMSFPIKQT